MGVVAQMQERPRPGTCLVRPSLRWENRLVSALGVVLQLTLVRASLGRIAPVSDRLRQ